MATRLYPYNLFFILPGTPEYRFLLGELLKERKGTKKKSKE